MHETTRRRMLSAGAALAAGSLSGMSGCTEDLPVGGGEGGDDGPSVPAFSLWLYAPDVLGMGAYSYTHVDVDAVDGNSEFDVNSSSDADSVAMFLRQVDLDGIESAVSVDYPDSDSFGVAVRGSLDLADIRTQVDEAVQENDDVESESYGDYELYFDDTTGVALAEDDSAILQARSNSESDSSGRAIVEAMIDARRGTVDRLAEVDEDAAALLSHQSDVALAYGTTRPYEHKDRLFDSSDDGAPDVVAGGHVVELGDEIERRLLLVTADPVDDAQSFGESLVAIDQESDPTFDREGRVVTVTIQSGADGSGGSDRVEPPQVAFDAQFDVESGTATITHQGGDAVRSDELELVFETSDPRTVSWADRSTHDEVTAGRAIDVELREADAGGQLLVQWMGGDRPTTLAQFTIPPSSDGGEQSDDETSGERPQVSLDAEFDFDRGEVTVIHAGGDEVPADELDIVFLSDDYREIRWSEVSDQSTVSPGDSATVEFGEADYGGRLLLGWNPETVELDSVQIPER